MEINNSYHGFKLLEEQYIKDIDSTARLFQHIKSGARLFHLENKDDNKVFSISFRTPPINSTGLTHILEHSVLCGSRKFPVKEPFVELIKGSLNTFLNALTFADKTMYPVASRNSKDFRNLMDVYLDAVLYPNIYKYPEIMMQEGWHYELENKESELNYKGVVYNEMKGVFSSPDSILMRRIQGSLFPDTPYGFVSGGDPDVIPELTQEQFLDFHKKYYHPSNSYIYLYGDLDIMDTLNFIDKEYLNNFSVNDLNSEIPLQRPFNDISETVVEYPITPDEKEEDKAQLSLNYVIGRSTDAETCLAFEILEHILLETSAAPLKRALIDANIGKDIFGSFDDGILQPTFSIVVKNSNMDKKEEFKKVVSETLQRLVHDGISKELIESSINIKEFSLREADFDGYPKGLIYNIQCLNSWLYGESPIMHLYYNTLLDKVKIALTTDYFENLIDKYLLNNTHSSFVAITPKRGLAEQKAEELKKKLSEYKASLSEDEINNIIENTKRLKERQTTPDPLSEIEKIPLLSLSDISPEAEKLPLIEKTELNTKVLFHPQFTNNIGYLNLYFDTSVVPQEKLPYIALLSRVLGRINTENYKFEDLSNIINTHTGGIRFNGEAYSKVGTDEVYYPKFTVRSKVLLDKLPKLIEILEEIIGHSKFDDAKRIKEIVQELESRLSSRMLERGHSIAAKRACSYFSPISKYDETLSGLDFYRFIADLEKNFDSKSQEVIDNLKELTKIIFNKNNLLISFTSDENSYDQLTENLPKLFGILSDDTLAKVDYQFKFGAFNEGLMTSAKVQYVAKAFNYRKLGYSYKGSLQVLKTIVGYDYLWNKVRVQGGAYGAFARFEWGGNSFFSSYRDPNLVETINSYKGAGEYVKNFDVDDRQMTKYIIGTVNELDYPLTPSMKGEIAAQYYIRQITHDAVQKERTEILNTKVSDIKNLSSLVSDVMDQNYLCVLGGEEKIKENKELFGTVLNLFD